MSDMKSSLLVLLLLAVAVAMLADLSTAPRDRFTAANYNRLELGMTMEDAVAILGEPDSLDQSLQSLAWAMWYSPFDAESSITGIFVEPQNELRSIEFVGTLPERPLHTPKVLPERVMPTDLVNTIKHAQQLKRMETLMLNPPKPPSKGPVLP